mmetsp:Transcript_46516/g.86972  ORF Transcript_46516/g.86972 Transcript_46516/m.86972 type:complete len:179 (-) Transcript_46516:4-540(-)
MWTCVFLSSDANWADRARSASSCSCKDRTSASRSRRPQVEPPLSVRDAATSKRLGARDAWLSVLGDELQLPFVQDTARGERAQGFETQPDVSSSRATLSETARVGAESDSGSTEGSTCWSVLAFSRFNSSRNAGDPITLQNAAPQSCPGAILGPGGCCTALSAVATVMAVHAARHSAF